LNEKNFYKNESPNKKRNLKLKTFYIALFIWFFTIGFYFVIFFGISQLANKISSKIALAPENTFSVYKPGIDIMNDLSGTDYLKYIQRMYVHPKDKNRIMIMIKPNYWGFISDKEKEKIKSDVLEKWKKIYKKSDKQEEGLEPEINFANS